MFGGTASLPDSAPVGWLRLALLHQVPHQAHYVQREHGAAELVGEELGGLAGLQSLLNKLQEQSLKRGDNTREFNLYCTLVLSYQPSGVSLIRLPQCKSLFFVKADFHLCLSWSFPCFVSGYRTDTTARKVCLQN